MNFEILNAPIVKWSLGAPIFVVGFCCGYCLQLTLPMIVLASGLGEWWQGLSLWIPLVVQSVQVLAWFALSVFLLRRVLRVHPIQPFRLAVTAGLALGAFMPAATHCLMLLLWVVAS